MDPLSATASIIAVIDLSLEVVKFVGAATGATKERRRLREEVLACENILQDLKDEADDSEEGTSWSKTIEALNGRDAPLGRLFIALKLVKVKLEPQNGGNKLRSSLRWPFEVKEVDKIISVIEREKALLNLALNNNHRKLIQSLQKSTKENTGHLLELSHAIEECSRDNQDRFAEVKDDLARMEIASTRLQDGIDNLGQRNDHQGNHEEVTSILHWLTPIDYTSQQSDFINRRTPGSGQWLLHSTKFLEWLETSKQILFCPGISGAGKTILASIVIEYLYTKFRNTTVQSAENVGIAYLYCNFHRQNDQTAYDLLVSLLKQLAQQADSFPGSVRNLYGKYKVRGTRPSISEILETLQAVVNTLSRVFIVIDALDECQTSNGCRTKVLTEILRLEANIFVTSRPIPEITEKFGRRITLEIRARDEDVEMYLDSHMSRLPDFVTTNQSLQEEIKSSIIELVQGMFLLAQLYVDSLVSKRSPKAIRMALKSLPAGSATKAYDFAYEDAMKRITGQPTDQADFAKQVLSWIVCAERPLTTLELQHALAIEPGELELDADNIPQIQDMVSDCAGLVTVDKKSRIIRLVHYTAQEYFDRTHRKWFPDAQAELARRCAVYLSYSSFESGRCESQAAYIKRIRSNALFTYAALNWGNHARQAKSICQEVESFLRCPGKVEASFQVLVYAKKINIPLSSPLRMSPLHAAAYYGLKKLVDRFLMEKEAFDSADIVLMTPLGWAARNGHIDVVERLLFEYGVQPDLAAAHYPTVLSWIMQVHLSPIFYAAERANEPLMKLLLEVEGVNVNARDFDLMTPLAWAAEHGYSSLVKLLLKSAQIEVNSVVWMTLGRAVERGYPSSVKLLLESRKVVTKGLAHRGKAVRDVELNHRDIMKLLFETHDDEVGGVGLNGRTPLEMAAHFGHADIVKLLLESDNVEAGRVGLNRRTLLEIAAHFGRADVVKLLLESDNVKAGRVGPDGRTPLEMAAHFGYADVVKLLLESDNIEAGRVGQDEQTPLELAVYSGHADVVKLLLERNDVEVNRVGPDGRTPLELAVYFGHTSVVKLLLETGKVEVDRIGPDEETPLETAVKFCHSSIVKLLLEIGNVEPDRDGRWGKTLLATAIDGGNLDTVELLLDTGKFDVEKAYGNRTPFNTALEKSDILLMILLLQYGANPQVQTMWAFDEVFDKELDQDCIEVMVAYGLYQDCQNSWGAEALAWAARRNCMSLVKALLIGRGVHPDTLDELGRSPLSWAAGNGHLDIAELLIQKGADLNAEDNSGRTPLWWAVNSGESKLVKFFLDQNTDLNAGGKLALKLAARKGFVDIVKLLLASKSLKGSLPDDWIKVALEAAAKSGHTAVVDILEIMPGTSRRMRHVNNR